MKSPNWIDWEEHYDTLIASKKTNTDTIRLFFHKVVSNSILGQGVTLKNHNEPDANAIEAWKEQAFSLIQGKKCKHENTISKINPTTGIPFRTCTKCQVNLKGVK